MIVLLALALQEAPHLPAQYLPPPLPRRCQHAGQAGGGDAQAPVNDPGKTEPQGSTVSTTRSTQ